jgi:peptidoglycan/LPS O-acetylase OafA/YrhL
MSASETRHYPCLDGLRGIAILLVIPHNADIVQPVLHGPFRLFTLLVDRGWVGVELFFVLSGFLITEQLYASRAAANYFGGFYARRALRIVPLFAVAVAFAYLLIKAARDRGEAAVAAPWWLAIFGLLLVNWTQPFGLGIPGFPQFWSLAVEEQFYLVWPWVVRSFASRLLAMAAVIAIVALGIRLLMLILGASSFMVYMWTISRMDALALGALAALIIRRWRLRGVPAASPKLVAWCAVAFVIGALSTRLYAGGTWPTQTVGFTCLGLACLFILLGSVANDLSPRHSPLFSFLRSPALASVGRYSYGMYVFHMFFAIFAAAWVKRLMAPLGDARMLGCALLMIALSYAAGFLSYHLYEKHFLRLSHRNFAPREAPTGESLR